MSSKVSQRFLSGSFGLGLTFALGLWINTSSYAITPVKVSQTGGSTMQRPTMMKKDQANNIVGVASSISDFSTLVAAVKAAGLVETLSGKGPFTVFAPTNEAFAKLPKGTIESLLKPENKAKLQKVLTYHVVSGKVLSTSIRPGTVKTVEGSTVNLQLKGSSVMVNTAKVIKADVPASNGVIHVIDTVILPPNL